jgi:Kdo2-lipid IVA lauroyltransferase/acyltransferase
MSRMLSGLGIGFMRLCAPLPLSWVRALGAFLGWVLLRVAHSRRRIVEINLRRCMPELPESERRELVKKVFVYFAQAWMDRSWLWYGTRTQLEHRLRLRGDVQALRETPRLVIFAPHFHGLEAGALAINMLQYRELSFIYARQVNPVIDQWMLERRQRFGGLHPFLKGAGVQDIARSIKSGRPLHLSPDMDFGRSASEFVPFFGIPAATVTSLSRFARLARADVITLSNILTPEGYDIVFSSVWPDFPTADAMADTARMNRELEALIRQDPAQYYWVHKRFKTQPSGQAAFYRR